MDISPLLHRLLEEDQAKQNEDLFRLAVKVMPTVMMQVLEEVRGIPDIAIMSMEYVLHHHSPKDTGPAAIFNVEQKFHHYEFKSPIPEMVLKCRLYVNARRTVRIVLVSSLGAAKLNELKEHLDCDTTFETYIGPYPWSQNEILKKEKTE